MKIILILVLYSINWFQTTCDKNNEEWISALAINPKIFSAFAYEVSGAINSMDSNQLIRKLALIGKTMSGNLATVGEQASMLVGMTKSEEPIREIILDEFTIMIAEMCGTMQTMWIRNVLLMATTTLGDQLSLSEYKRNVDKLLEVSQNVQLYLMAQTEPNFNKLKNSCPQNNMVTVIRSLEETVAKLPLRKLKAVLELTRDDFAIWIKHMASSFPVASVLHQVCLGMKSAADQKSKGSIKPHGSMLARKYDAFIKSLQEMDVQVASQTLAGETEKETLTVVKGNIKLSQADFANKLYRTLSEKFPYCNWVVVSMDFPWMKETEWMMKTNSEFVFTSEGDSGRSVFAAALMNGRKGHDSVLLRSCLTRYTTVYTARTKTANGIMEMAESCLKEHSIEFTGIVVANGTDSTEKFAVKGKGEGFLLVDIGFETWLTENTPEAMKRKDFHRDAIKVTGPCKPGTSRCMQIVVTF